MTLTDAVGRIQQIQSTLTMLAAPAARAQATPPVTTTTVGSSAAPTQSGAANRFAEALAEAVVPADVPGAVGVAEVPGTPVAVPGPVPVPASADAARLIEAARAYEGVPYVWGGTDPATGLDCSGFVQRAYADIGIQLPRVTWDQMNAGTRVPSLAEAQPGDLLFSHDGGHVSMYLGGGKAIDAPQPGQTVSVRDMWETDANLTTIRRVLPEAPAGAASVASAAPTAVPGAPGAADAYAAQAAFLASMAR